MNDGDRIEKIVTVISNKPDKGYCGIGYLTEFKDEEGNKYIWNTISITKLQKGQRWKVRMTVDSKRETKKYYVSRLAFMEKLGD